MLIRDVRATWLRCPIPVEQQHVSDFGRITSFDTTIVRIEVARRPGRLGGGQGWCRQLGLLSCGGGGRPRRPRAGARRAGCAAPHRGVGHDVQRIECRLRVRAWTRLSGAGAARSRGRRDERDRHGPVGPARQVARRARRGSVGRTAHRHASRLRERWVGRRGRDRRAAPRLRGAGIRECQDARRRHGRRRRDQRGTCSRRPHVRSVPTSV